MRKLWGRVRFTVILFKLLLTASAVGAVDLSKARPHLTFNIASHHAGASQHFNEENYGIGIGFNAPSDNGKWRYGVEAGFYRNSNNDRSEYVIASADRKVASLGEHTDLGLGVVGGFANYHGGAEGFGNKGIPTFGDWLIVGGATVSVRHKERTEFRMGIHPAPEIADFLLTFQVRFNM